MSKDGPVLGMVPTGSTYAGGLVAKSCLSFCDPMDFSSPGSSVHGISQARILEWVAISFYGRHLPDPGIEPQSPARGYLAI